MAERGKAPSGSARREGERSEIRSATARLRRARRFPANTDPCARHVEIMGEVLSAGKPYPMFAEEPLYCAMSLLLTVAGLYEARNRLGEVDAAPAGLTAIGKGSKWTEVDAAITGLDAELWRRSSAAREVARTARRSGDLVKWQKFCAVARAYELASRHLLDKFTDLAIPF